MHNIDSALIYALIALFQMASSNKDSWVQDLRKLICTNHGRGWRVNGEGSGRTKVIYVINEGKGAANNRLTKTININWEKANIAKINGAIDFIKPLVVNKKVSLSDAAKRWEAQNLPQEKKVSDVIWDEVLIAFEKTKEGLSSKTGMEWTRRVDRFREVMNKKPTPTSGEDFVENSTLSMIEYSRLYELLDLDASRRKNLDSIRIRQIMESLGWHYDRRRIEGDQKRGFFKTK